MTKLRVAVVGVGSLGSHHARIYSQLPEAQLTAVVDIDEARAKSASEKYGAAAFTDYRDVFGLVDAVSIAVPTEKHSDIGTEFLGRGIAALVEKPMARSIEEATALITSAQSGRAVLRVGHTERFNPAVCSVLPYIRGPRFFESHRLGVFVPRSLDIDVVLDLMIHDLDLVLRLTDSPVQEIKSVGIPILTPRVDIANARIQFENGCVANITASRVSKDKVRKLRFFQPNDYISIDFFKQEVEMYSLVSHAGGKRVQERAIEVCRDEPLKRELQSFLRAVRGEQTPEDKWSGCTGEQGREVLALAHEILAGMHGA